MLSFFRRTTFESRKPLKNLLKTSFTLSNFIIPSHQLTINGYKSILWSRMLQSDIGEQSELGIQSKFIPRKSIGVLWCYQSGRRFPKGFRKPRAGRHISYMLEHKKPEVFQRSLILGFRSTFFVYFPPVQINSILKNFNIYLF